jgi:acetyl-CoA acetyltransferase
MMRLAPSGEVLGKIARLLEEGTIRPDVATVYALQDVAEAWKDIARNLPGVHGMSPSRPGVTRDKSHGKIVLRVALRDQEIKSRAYELFIARGAEPGRELEDWLQAERELTAESSRRGD